MFYEGNFPPDPPESEADLDRGLSLSSPLSSTTRSSQASRYLPTPSTQAPTPQVPTPQAAMTHRVPTFNFCGRYTGKEMSASRWLKLFDHELSEFRGEDGLVPPATYLRYLDLLLSGEAAEWVESNPEAVRLMATQSPTQATVSQFVSLLQERFPSKAVESSPVSFDLEVSELRQKQDESLKSYYSRTLNLMQKYGAKDRSIAVVLSLAESSLLDTFLRVWIKGLSDPSIKRKAAEGMGDPSRSMKAVYGLAEQARITDAEVRRLCEEESKEDELSFYKGLAEKIMTSQQLSSMLATHHASRMGRPASTPHHWSVHEDPRTPNHYPSLRQESQPPPYRSEGPTKSPPYLIQHPQQD